MARSAAICANGGRFEPYPQSFSTTTMSWGLSAMHPLYIRYSRIANEATALLFGTPNTTGLDPRAGKCTGKSLFVEIRMLTEANNLEGRPNRQLSAKRTGRILRGFSRASKLDDSWRE